MSQPEDAAAQALRLAALALQQISTRSSSSSSDEDDTAAVDASTAASAQPTLLAADAELPLAQSASVNLSSKLLSSVAQVKMLLCTYLPVLPC